jgi:hypothetical protein
MLAFETHKERTQGRLEIVGELNGKFGGESRMSLPRVASRARRDFAGSPRAVAHAVLEPPRASEQLEGLGVAPGALDVRLIEPMDPALVAHRKEHPVLQSPNGRDALPESPRDLGTGQGVHS